MPLPPGPAATQEVDDLDRYFTGYCLLGDGLALAFTEWLSLASSQCLLKLGGLSLYAWVSYRVSAKPDYSNLGWWGGLLDNPFRSSDNVNRWLLYLRILLVPGQLIAYSFVMSWVIFEQLTRRFNS